MHHIDGYFSKLKAAFAGQASKKDAVLSACEKVGVKILPEQFEIRNEVLYLKTSSAAKSVIFMKKEMILAEINQKIKPAIVDIR